MKLPERFFYYCAPVLMGVKSANTFSIANNETETFFPLFSKWDIDYKFLYKDKTRKFLLIYRSEKLDCQLQKEDTQCFLQEYGYPSRDLNKCLNRLAAHLQNYHDRKESFPHELGCFLDYPVHDIRGFVNNNGKNYIYCGYWKVYQQLESAKQLFSKYDEAKKIISLRN